MTRIFETHCHLNNDRFADDYAETLARARAAGVTELILIGYDLPTSRRVVELARPEEGLYATVGLHPHDALNWNAGAARELRELARAPGVVAIGEIGLDFFRDLSPREAQYSAFHAQLELALELGMQIVVHTRESIPEALDVLEPYARRGLRGVLHCWTGTPEEARRALDFGFHLGVGGPITYKKPGDLPLVVAEMPLDRLLLETDSPYLPPVPHRGQRNEPAYLPLIAARVAETRGTTPEEVARVTRDAALSLFGLASAAKDSEVRNV